jgi:hypothetical protein
MRRDDIGKFIIIACMVLSIIHLCVYDTTAAIYDILLAIFMKANYNVYI